MVNGVLSSAAMGLDNHASNVGDSLDFGAVNAGDTLTIVLHNLTVGADAYSNPSLNIGYDGTGAPGHNHVYSTAYTATSPVFAASRRAPTSGSRISRFPAPTTTTTTAATSSRTCGPWRRFPNRQPVP